jgi:phage terminase large subunit-like protein
MAILKLTDEEYNLAMVSPPVRREIAQQSFFHFLLFYMQDQFELEPATFHTRLIETLEAPDPYIAVLGFRGSAKSTFVELYALWAMLTGKNEFIVMIGATLDDARMNLANIRDTVETNPMLMMDFGVNLESKKQQFSEKWTEGQLTLGNCTILARSKGSKIRGAKFKKARIDMIICDDLEDVKEAEKAENRKKTRQWFFTEVLPATKQGVLAVDVKVVMIGNLVHRDCLLKYMQKSSICTVHEFPLLDPETGEIMWRGLYPDMNAINAEKAKVMIAGEGMGSVIWAREYLLVEADEEDQPLRMSEIQRYPREWLQRPTVRAGIGNDLAISQKQKADDTTFIPFKEVIDDDGLPKLLLMPHCFGGKLKFTKTIKKAVEMDMEMPEGSKLYGEKVAYQESAYEMMENNGIMVVRMTPTSDKLTRTTTACYHVISGRVLFPPEDMCNEHVLKVIQQLVGFGLEPRDDYADGFSIAVIGMVSKKKGILFG